VGTHSRGEGEIGLGRGRKGNTAHGGAPSAWLRSSLRDSLGGNTSGGEEAAGLGCCVVWRARGRRAVVGLAHLARLARLKRKWNLG
jgi:hypothetical protein